MKFSTLLIAAAATLASTPALAKDATPFSGPHAGLEAGWGRVGGDRIPSDGFIYGANVGYDAAVGALRFGPEAEIADSTQKTCTDLPAGGPIRRTCQRSDRDLYIGGRFGVVVDPHAMLYAKVGYTNARFSDRTEGTTTVSDGQDRSGVRVGGGVEYAVTPAIYLSGEYRYSHYSSNIHQNQVLGGVGIRF